MIFAECKWRNEIKDISLLNGLMEKAALFSDCEDEVEKYYYIFSKSDFSKQCRSLAERAENVRLVSLCGLFQPAKKRPRR